MSNSLWGWSPANTVSGPDTCLRSTPGAGDASRFEALLDGCRSLAAAVGTPNLLAGVNLPHEEAYLRMLARGFRAEIPVVTMHRPNEAGYCHPGALHPGRLGVDRHHEQSRNRPNRGSER